MRNPAPSIDVSVVIPAFCSARSAPILLERLVRVLDQLGRTYEIVVVDDCSPDDTWHALKGAKRLYGDRLTLVRLSRNTGQHNALMCGFHHSRGQLIATMDDDLQHQPEELPNLIDTLERDDLDLVYGNYRTKQHNIWRKIVTIPIGLFHKHLFRMSTVPTSFRVAKRWLIDSILHHQGPFVVVDGLLAWNTRRIGGVIINHSPRAIGRSTHSFPKLLQLAFNIFTNFSLMPLRFISIVGFAAAAAGGALAIVSWWWSDGRSTVENLLWSMFSVLFILGGLQLLAMGLLGEYLGRVHLTVNRKPQFIVQTVLAADKKSDVEAEPTFSSRT